MAHRGSSETNAEHTLAAYLAALEEGADALECDVRLTSDGHLVCLHDRDLRRTAALDHLVSNTTLAELQELDFSSWKRPWADLDEEAELPDRRLGGVLTMRDLLRTVADHDRRIELAIETKHPTRYAGLVERRLVELLEEFCWTAPGTPVRVMSFSAVALRRVRRAAVAVPLVLLLDAPTQWARARPVADPDWIAGPGIDLLRRYPDLIHRIRESGTRLHVWTVNTEEDVERCLAHDVEAIITDRPAAVAAYLAQLEQ